MDLGDALASEHEVSVVAQRVDEGHHGRLTHILREAPSFEPFGRGSVDVRQLRLPRRRRLLLVPFVAELLPLAGRLSLRWLRAYTSRYYAAVARRTLAPLLAGADIVHVLGGDLLAAAAVKTGHALGKPVVITPSAHPGDWGLDAGSVRAYRDADAVLANAKADASIYRGVGVADRSLYVCGHPVPRPLTANGPPATDADGAPTVLFLGARRPYKGWDLLLEAAPLVWRARPDVRFAFVGPGDPLGSHDPRILDVGRVSEDDRARWLERAALLCLPSTWEAFGLVVVEAWSKGKPVVVSDIPVLRELVDGAGGGLLVRRERDAVAAAITRLVEDRGLAREMGEAGRDHWEANYKPAAVARRHVDVYRRVIAGRV
jgi:glycosyltransferase involved in cell wall biosynthesis